LIEDGSDWVEKLADVKEYRAVFGFLADAYRVELAEGVCHFTVSPDLINPQYAGGYVFVPAMPFIELKTFVVMKYDASNENA
jgi:hypothetical protein